MFANIKDKLSGTIKNIASELRRHDEHDKTVEALVERGASSLDWEVNFQIVDFVNSNPTVFSEKALRAARATFVKGTPKVQVLVLGILEACIKNCAPSFHSALSTSDIWSDMLKLAAADSSSSSGAHSANAEVRAKVLSLVDDCAHALTLQPFKDAYDGLVSKGVEFPVRAAGERMQPYIAPTPLTNIATATPPLESAAHAAPAMAQPPIAATAMQRDAAPSTDMSPEDRAAVAAAMAEMAVLPPAAGTEPGGTASHGQAVPHSQAVAPAATPGDVLPPPPATSPPQANVETPEQAAASLLVTKNSCDLLAEMLATVPDDSPSTVLQAVVTELAGQCADMRKKLERSIGNLIDEAQLAAALAQHDELVKVQARYDALVARAAPALPSSSLGPIVTEPTHAAIAQHLATSRGHPGGAAGVALDAAHVAEAGVVGTTGSRRHTFESHSAASSQQSTPHSHGGHSHVFKLPPPVPEEAPIDLDPNDPLNDSSLAAASVDVVERHSGPPHSTSLARSSLTDDPFIALLGDEVPLTASHETTVRQYDEMYGVHYDGDPQAPVQVVSSSATSSRRGSASQHTLAAAMPEEAAAATAIAATAAPAAATVVSQQQQPLQRPLQHERVAELAERVAVELVVGDDGGVRIRTNSGTLAPSASSEPLYIAK